eukprot:scaffold17.g546.t1
MKGKKRKATELGGSENGGGEAGPCTSAPTIGQQTAGIRNKIVRSQKYAQLRASAKREKKKARAKRDKEIARAEELGQEPPPKPTIESTREADETVVGGDDGEVAADEGDDEFAAHFARERPPHVLLTTCYKPTGRMYKLTREMLTINGLLLVHLPDGPTARFRLSNLVLGQDIKGHGRASSHRPELVLNNFDTRLGHRVGRMLASLFHQDPTHHRYIFEEKERKEKGSKEKRPVVKARLQELGPRFTLRLQSLQKGTFDSQGGEFEWLLKPETEGSRRRFNLSGRTMRAWACVLLGAALMGVAFGQTGGGCGVMTPADRYDCCVEKWDAGTVSSDSTCVPTTPGASCAATPDVATCCKVKEKAEPKEFDITCQGDIKPVKCCEDKKAANKADASSILAKSPPPTPAPAPKTPPATPSPTPWVPPSLAPAPGPGPVLAPAYAPDAAGTASTSGAAGLVLRGLVLALALALPAALLA